MIILIFTFFYIGLIEQVTSRNLELILEHCLVDYIVIGKIFFIYISYRERGLHVGGGVGA